MLNGRRPRWWLTANLVWRKRVLMRAIYTKTQEIDQLSAERLDFQRELVEVDAAIDAAKDDGVDLLAEWRAREPDNPEVT